jgi:fused signal recognition particle receptor
LLRGLFRRVGAVLRGRAIIDDELLEGLEEALMQGDVSAPLAIELVDKMRDASERKRVTDADGLKEALRQEVTQILLPLEGELVLAPEPPTVILVLGVNGVGKTTTIAKLAHLLKQQGKRPLLAAADTFRAAAIEQLEIWAQRAGCDIVRQKQGADPAAVVYDALQAAKARAYDVVICDTAGRLHTKKNLMEELRKIGRIIEREIGRDADERLLVIDATTGQNAVNQVREFSDLIGLTGLVVAKLDGTAKGGVMLTVAKEFGLPIKFVGVGEKMADLEPFSAESFAEGMFD